MHVFFTLEGMYTFSIALLKKEMLVRELLFNWDNWELFKKILCIITTLLVFLAKAQQNVCAYFPVLFIEGSEDTGGGLQALQRGGV